MPSVLFIFTNAAKTLTGSATGYYLPEAAHPYYVLSPTTNIDFASATGGEIPLDPSSAENFAEDPECIRWLADETVKAKFASAKKLSEVDVNAYDAIFYPGGHGPAIDLPTNEDNIAFATRFYASGKTVAAVCHGSAALVNVKNTQGKPVYAGKRATGFSDLEEQLVSKFCICFLRIQLKAWKLDAVNAVPFLTEARMKQVGAKYEKAAEAWGSHIVVDGTLITGQNPASGRGVGEAILKALKTTAVDGTLRVVTGGRKSSQGVIRRRVASMYRAFRANLADNLS
ncbi:DJ-1 protein-PfpI domain-containing protein [Mycena chlorophos]|uniref:D-lactate dehydratase n=1 Tax=Mycena chlorophos TaxID=658473 RepID=A0A8H6VQJ2_MYCCL|nr:DJ-1 protein-PfpI domain-containing protein [Mycena chlorophos]